GNFIGYRASHKTDFNADCQVTRRFTQCIGAEMCAAVKGEKCRTEYLIAICFDNHIPIRTDATVTRRNGYTYFGPFRNIGLANADRACERSPGAVTRQSRQGQHSSGYDQENGDKNQTV